MQLVMLYLAAGCLSIGKGKKAKVQSLENESTNEVRVSANIDGIQPYIFYNDC